MFPPPLPITHPLRPLLLRTLALRSILHLSPTGAAISSTSSPSTTPPAMEGILEALEDPEMGIADLLASSPDLPDLTEIEEEAQVSQNPADLEMGISQEEE